MRLSAFVTKIRGTCHQRDVKEATNDCFIFDTWFSSKRLTDAEFNVGADMIFMVKTNNKDSLRIPLRS